MAGQSNKRQPQSILDTKLHSCKLQVSMPYRLKRCWGPGCLSPCNVMDTPDLEKRQISKAESWCWGRYSAGTNCFNKHLLQFADNKASWSALTAHFCDPSPSMQLCPLPSTQFQSWKTHRSVLPGFVMESRRSETWQCPWSSHRSLLASRSVSRSARMSPRHSDNFLQWNACRINRGATCAYAFASMICEYL